MVGCELDGITQEAPVFMLGGGPIILGNPMVG